MTNYMTTSLINECINCNAEINTDSQDSYIVNHEGDYICHDCSDYYSKCDDCNKWFHENDLHSDHNYTLCADCFDNGDYFVCDCCGDIKPSNEINTVNNGDIVCDYCLDRRYWQCYDCDTWYHNNDDCYYYGDNSICDNCMQDNYSVCDCCNEIIHNDDICYDNNNGQYCEYCYENQDDDCEEFNQKIRFLKTDKDKPSKNLFFGVEYEICFNDRADSYIIKKDYDDLIFNGHHDCSLNSDGIEYNFNPFTRSYFDLFKSKYEELFDHFNNSCYTTSVTGIHIHIPKCCISRLEHLKIYLVCEKMDKDFCNKIFNRSYDQYDRYSNDYKLYYRNSNVTGNVAIWRNFHGNYDKMYKINSLHNKTIEFRHFGTTTNFEIFQSYFEWLDLLVKYVKESSLQNCDFSSFLHWIQENFVDNKKYTHIINSLIKHEYINTHRISFKDSTLHFGNIDSLNKKLADILKNDNTSFIVETSENGKKVVYIS